MEKIDLIKKKLSALQGIEKTRLRVKYAEQIRLTDPEECENQAKTAYTESREFNDTQLEFTSIYTLCALYIDRKEIEEALKWIRKLEIRGLEEQDNLVIGGAYYYKYRISRLQCNLTEAADDLLKALEFLNENDHPSYVANCYIGLGNVYYYLSDYDKAMDFYNRALPLSTKHSNGYFFIKQNIASVYMKKEKYRDAWMIYHEILDTLPDNLLAVKKLVLENLGHVCSKIGEFDESIEYYTQVISLIDRHGVKEDKVKLLCDMAYVYITLQDYKQAELLLNEAEEIAINTDKDSVIEEVYKCKINFYGKLDDKAQIIRLQEKLLEIKEDQIKKINLEKVNEKESNIRMENMRK